MVIANLTAIAGSSDVVDRGFVTYSNAAKAAMLGVPMPLIESVGAVSAEVAAAMAEGALKASGAGLTVAITGIAGPGGGSSAKPVGLVHLAAVSRLGDVNRIERRYDPALGREGIVAPRPATRSQCCWILPGARAFSPRNAATVP